MELEELKKEAHEVILKCKDKCYKHNGRNASNNIEGDYGTWEDWEEVLRSFAEKIYQAGIQAGKDMAVDYIKKELLIARQETFSGENEVHDTIDRLLGEARQ